MTSLPLFRAPIFVPADRPERFAKAAATGADAIILDLEDAVAADNKAAARAQLRADFTDKPVIVRINASTNAYHAEDLAAVRILPIAGVMLAKAESAAEAASVAESCGKPVVALIESALGLAEARAIARASGVAQLAFGSVDFCADLSCAHLREVLLPARFELVLASKLAGIAAPLDGVTTQLDDPAITHDDASHARALGMGGKLCIHPKQIAEVLRAFAPSAAEIAWAERVLASGDGAAKVDGEMVDEPVRIRARQILRAAQ